jgi:hypothetical protein
MPGLPSEWRVINLSGREKGNAYLAALEETGVIGTAVLCLPILMFLLRGLDLRLIRQPIRQTRDFMAAACYSGALGGFVSNLGEATLWSPGSLFPALALFLAGSADVLLPRNLVRRPS